MRRGAIIRIDRPTFLRRFFSLHPSWRSRCNPRSKSSSSIRRTITRCTALSRAARERDPEPPVHRVRRRHDLELAGFRRGQVHAAAALLAERGIRKGDRVAVMGRNSDGHVLMLFALARIGAIMVPVNPEFGVEEARYVLHHAEVSGVVASGDTLAVAREACEGLATAPWFLMLDEPQRRRAVAERCGAPRAARRDAAARRRRRRHRPHRLHLGHDRLSQRRDAQPEELRHRRRSVRAARLSAGRRSRDDRAAALSHQRALLFGRRHARRRLRHGDRAALLRIDVLADGGRLRARPKSTSSKRSARS